MDLTDKVVIITGASQGIGAAIAKSFAKEKAKIVLCYRNNKQGAKRIFSEIGSYSPDAMLFQGDLSDEDTVKALFDKVLGKYGQVDILINNAGKSNPKDILTTGKNDWIEAFNNNFFNTVLTSKYAIQAMKDQALGKIINMSSINGLAHVGRSGNIAYSAAKATIINFTKTLAKGYAPNILVNAVAPGLTLTEYWDKVDKDFRERSSSNVPIKRFIKPEEIADVFLFLAKNDSLTGEVITADGGFNLKDYS